MIRLVVILSSFAVFTACKDSGEITMAFGKSMESIGQIPRNIAKELVGPDKKDDSQDQRVKELEDKIRDLESKSLDLQNEVARLDGRIDSTNEDMNNLRNDLVSNVNELRGLIDNLDTDQDRLEGLIQDNYNSILALELALSNLSDDVESGFDSIGDDLEDTNDRIGDLEDDLDELEEGLDEEERVVEVVYPCGDRVNVYDEVLFKTNQGKFYAYFEQGNNRFMSSLPNGDYRTTDGTSCNFRINNGNLTRLP